MEVHSHIFQGIEDPRRSNATRHDLQEMLMIALLCTLCGGEGCSDMAVFGRSKEAFLRTFMRLGSGIPSHDAFSDLFNALDPAPFQTAMLRLIEGFALELGEVIAIDGKSVRRSFDTAKETSPLHLVQAFSAEARLMLGQVAVGDRSNEIPAVPALLEMLDLAGRTVTADAMHAQRATAQAIRDKGGDYVLALKGNQETLHDDVRLYLDDPENKQNIPSFQGVDGDHGRIETRKAEITPDIGWLQETHDWPGLAAIGKVTSTRETRKGTATHTRYYLLSSNLSPERFLAISRAHWSIENSLHWVLDVTMNEDGARNRTGNGPENLAILRRMALNLARAEPSKGSMRGKFKRAGWQNEYMIDLIRAALKIEKR